MPRLPNFFVAGVPKAGTTSLYYYLDQHPQIFMSPIKEPHFFAPEIRAENCIPELRENLMNESRSLSEYLSQPMRVKRFGGIITNWDDYLRLFANATHETALGEASVCYLWSRKAAALIAERIPDAKIIVMLRNPVDRAFSQYLHGVAEGAIRWSFREHIERNLRYRSHEICVHYPFLELGMYAEQLDRILKQFGSNVWIGFHDDFKRWPLETLSAICRFLCVSDDFQPDMGRRHLEAQVPRLRVIASLKRSRLWKAAAGLTPGRLRPLARRVLNRKPGADTISPQDRRYLIDFYREDVLKLAALLNRNLDDWLRIE
ncbi:MAG TPA: sulfotransferase [Bryobacteraceae bacterium]|nr:sulfotransferase [Bryobacteraceae bacterium]